MFKMIGDIPEGLPKFQMPPFSIPEVRNETGAIIQAGESFSEMVSSLGSGLVVVPLIALLENIAICKAFANGKAVDATQELIAIGTANIANSFVQGYPGTGALSRGAVNNASGVRTPMGSLYTGAFALNTFNCCANFIFLSLSGILVILALLFFTPYFFYIPKSALAGIIIAAVIFMVEVRVVKPMWRSKKSDLVPGIAAFIACLVLPIELGILVGIGINIVFILYHASRPKIHMEKLIVSELTDSLVDFYSIVFPTDAIKGNQISSAYTRSLPHLPVGRLRSESHQQAGPEVASAGRHRLHAHLRSRLHRRQGRRNAAERFPQAKAAAALLQPQAFGVLGVRGSLAGLQALL